MLELGGDTMIPHTFSLTPDHSLISRRSGWTWTSNLWNHEAALLPLSHRSLVWTCAGTYISLFSLSFYNKPVKFWTHWAGVWTHDTTTILIVSNVCSVISATLAFTLKTGVCTTLLDIMQYMSFNVSNSGVWTQDSTIPTHHSASWATGTCSFATVINMKKIHKRMGGACGGGYICTQCSYFNLLNFLFCR